MFERMKRFLNKVTRRSRVEEPLSAPMMFPIACKGCIHLRGRIEDGALIFDRCTIIEGEITDEMLDEPCKNYEELKE